MYSENYPPHLNSTFINEASRNRIKKEDVTIVIPTLNEENAIELVLKDVLLEGYPKTLVIDGNSADKTVKIVEKMRVPIYTQSGRGKTGAIKTALNYIETPYFGVIDGDCTYSARDIEALLEKAPYYSQVIGARRDRANIKLLNRLGNNVINLIFNITYGTRLTDVCSGLYVLDTSFAKKLVLETGGFDVEVEIAAQAAASNRVAEVPISYSSRVGVQKLDPLRDGFLIMSSIIKLSRMHNPLMFYSYLSGFILAIAGFGLTVLDIFVPFNYLSFSFMYLGILFIGASILLLMMATFLSQLKYLAKK
ncbi:MAG: glycosyltransferase family 2 protein [Candidatus Bathyarchaeia archaeon]|jgi:dolichol-phosphate mannosyltransferase